MVSPSSVPKPVLPPCSKRIHRVILSLSRLSASFHALPWFIVAAAPIPAIVHCIMVPALCVLPEAGIRLACRAGSGGTDGRRKIDRGEADQGHQQGCRHRKTCGQPGRRKRIRGGAACDGGQRGKDFTDTASCARP